MDGIGEFVAAIAEAVAMMAIAFAELMIAGAYLVAFLAETLFWAALCLFGRRGARPELRRTAGRSFAKGRWQGFALRLLPLVLMAGIFAGQALHDRHFRASIRFKSTNNHSIRSLQFEWVSRRGRTKRDEAGLFAKHYTTYRWNAVRITDPRFEPQRDSQPAQRVPPEEGDRQVFRPPRRLRVIGGLDPGFF